MYAFVSGAMEADRAVTRKLQVSQSPTPLNCPLCVPAHSYLFLSHLLPVGHVTSLHASISLILPWAVNILKSHHTYLNTQGAKAKQTSAQLVFVASILQSLKLWLFILIWLLLLVLPRNAKPVRRLCIWLISLLLTTRFTISLASDATIACNRWSLE